MTTARIITHNGHFHADDVFAVALLTFLHEAKNMPYEIIRSRDPEVWETGDYVVDVGDIYDAEKNRFDHHQEGGAGTHENGVPYSSLGLVWQKFGAEFAGSEEAANRMEKKFVEYIDARDNGVEVKVLHTSPVIVYDSGNMIEAFSLGWDEERSFNDAFLEALEVAKKILLRERTRAKSALRAEDKMKEAYQKTADKRLIILNRYYPSHDILINYPEPLYVVYSEKENGTWHVRAVRKNNISFENRKNFPAEWAGKRDTELARVSGVADAVFCHNNRFLAVAASKEGALALAKKALES